MLIPLSIQSPLLWRDASICILSQWVFSQRFISVTLPTEMKTLTRSCVLLRINSNCRGHRQSSEALGADNLHGCKSTDRKHPRKLPKYQGAPVNSFIEAAARAERKTKVRRQAERGRGGRLQGGGWILDLTCLGDGPVEPVNSGVPEVPLVAHISDNDLCLAMMVGDRYWQTHWPVSVSCQYLVSELITSGFCNWPAPVGTGTVGGDSD